MKICFIILSLLLISSIICKNENDSRIDFNLDFENDVAQTTISVTKNIIYYARIIKVEDGKYVNFELTMDYTVNSPFTKFVFHQYNIFIDGDFHSTYDISLSKNKKGNKLVLNGDHKVSNTLENRYNGIEFVSSCDIPNLQLKIEITTKDPDKTLNIINIIIIVLVVGIAIFCAVAFFCVCVCLRCLKRNPQNNSGYAPI